MGNATQMLGPSFQPHEAQLACCAQHEGVCTSDCGVLRNHFSPLDAPGSSLGSPRGQDGYGPEASTFSQGFWGGIPPRAPDPSGNGEALSSSTSERVLRDTASFRTSPSPPLAQVFLNAVGRAGHTMANRFWRISVERKTSCRNTSVFVGTSGLHWPTSM